MVNNSSGRVQFGPFEADLHTHELWKYGTRIKLVGQPFEVLVILLSKPGRLVTRKELRKRLWPGDTYVDFNHGLNAAVNRLRDALSDSAEEPRYVETLPRRGYRFIASGANQDLASAEAEPPFLEPISRMTSVRAEDSERQVTRSRSWPLPLLTACALVAVVLGGAFLYKNLSYSRSQATYSPGPRIRPLTSLADETSEPSFSPDGNYLAFRREAARPEESGIFIKALVSDQIAQLMRNDGDCCPVWAPDGSLIAFSRLFNREFGIYIVPLKQGQQHLFNISDASFLPATGGAERKLNTSGLTPNRGELAWAPDGRTMAFSSGAGIVLLAIDNSSLHHLTQPPPLNEDWGASFSPDGVRVLFVRSHET